MLAATKEWWVYFSAEQNGIHNHMYNTKEPLHFYVYSTSPNTAHWFQQMPVHMKETQYNYESYMYTVIVSTWPFVQYTLLMI